LTNRHAIEIVDRENLKGMSQFFIMQYCLILVNLYNSTYTTVREFLLVLANYL